MKVFGEISWQSTILADQLTLSLKALFSSHPSNYDSQCTTTRSTLKALIPLQRVLNSQFLTWLLFQCQSKVFVFLQSAYVSLGRLLFQFPCALFILQVLIPCFSITQRRLTFIASLTLVGLF